MTKGQLTDSDRLEIVKYRLEKAYRTYHEAKGAINSGFGETAANRLYYAAYYAVSALLISYKYEVSTHNGVIQMFGKAFLKNNIIDKKYGRTFNQLFSLPSNPQPIGFRGNLLVKRPKFFYCTYSLGITETS